MEIIINNDNNKVINIPDELLASISNNTPRDQKTSYLNEFRMTDGRANFNSDFLYRLVCYYNLWDTIKGKYKTSLDIFGGVGITAKMFQSSENQAYVNDINPDCYNLLRTNFPKENVFSFDVLNPPYPTGSFDLILADFNDFTVKKEQEVYGPALREMFNLSWRYVIVNDCSAFYLKYGRGSYETYSRLMKCPIEHPTLSHFYAAQKYYFEEKYPGWALTHVEYFNNSSFLLFERTSTEELIINRAVKQEIIKLKYANVPTNGLLWDR